MSLWLHVYFFIFLILLVKIVFSSDCRVLGKIDLESCSLSLCWKKMDKVALPVVPPEFDLSQEINLPLFLAKSHTPRTET